MLTESFLFSTHITCFGLRKHLEMGPWILNKIFFWGSGMTHCQHCRKNNKDYPKFFLHLDLRPIPLSLCSPNVYHENGNENNKDYPRILLHLDLRPIPLSLCSPNVYHENGNENNRLSQILLHLDLRPIPISLCSPNVYHENGNESTNYF